MGGAAASGAAAARPSTALSLRCHPARRRAASRSQSMATPIDELANARFGSRPAYRPGAKAGIEGIRAIPWGFGWTQIRLMLTGWLGVGTALREEIIPRHGLARLQKMASTWPFVDDLLAKVEMVCAKTDIDIARMYVEHLGGDMKLF